MSCGSGAVVTINGVTSTNKIQILIKNRSGFSKSVIFKFEDSLSIGGLYDNWIPTKLVFKLINFGHTIDHQGLIQIT